MALIDVVFWAFRQIRSRLLESILIVLGIGLGVAVITAVVGMLELQNDQITSILNSDQFRTFQIAPVQNTYNRETIDRPLDRIGAAGEETGKITFDNYLELTGTEIDGLEGCWVARMGAERLPSRVIERREEGLNPAAGSGEGSGEDGERLSPGEGGEGMASEQDGEEANPGARARQEREEMLEYLLVTPGVFHIFDFQLLAGSFFTTADLKARSKVVVLGKELAREYFGEAEAVGGTLNLNQGEYTVIGVAAPKKAGGDEVANQLMEYIPGLGLKDELNRRAFIPYFSYLTFEDDGAGQINQINIMARKGADLESFYQQLADYVSRNLGEGIMLNGTYLSRKEMESGQTAFGSLIGLFAVAALFIAAINILNLMLARVLRRQKKIGILAAVGASGREIFKQFLVEALLLGLMGSLIGIFLGQGGLYLLSRLNMTEMTLSVKGSLAGVVIALLTSLVFGLYPALQAARVVPADVLKTE